MVRYRKRNPDGTFGDLVETPGHSDDLAEEIKLLYETLAFMDMEMSSIREGFTEKINELTGIISELKTEVQALKGGEQ